MLVEILKTLDNEMINLVGIEQDIINSAEIEMESLLYKDMEDYYLADDLEDTKPKDLNLTIPFESEDMLEQTRTDLIELSNECNVTQAEILEALFGMNKEKTKDILRESNIGIIETL